MPNKCPLLPLADRVVVQPEGAPEKIGSLYTPTAQAPDRGTVVVVGPGRRWPSGEIDPIDLLPGDTVVHQRYVATDVEMNGTVWRLLRESDILCRLNDR